VGSAGGWGGNLGGREAGVAGRSEAVVGQSLAPHGERRRIRLPVARVPSHVPCLPGLLFFSTYTLLVLFWAEIYYQARSLPTGSLRPAFVVMNLGVYAIQVGAQPGPPAQTSTAATLPARPTLTAARAAPPPPPALAPDWAVGLLLRQQQRGQLPAAGQGAVGLLPGIRVGSRRLCLPAVRRPPVGHAAPLPHRVARAPQEAAGGGPRHRHLRHLLPLQVRPG
jgi:hypothetical protein